MTLLPVVFQFLQAVDSVYKSLIGVLWSTSVSYGLSPSLTFLLPFIKTQGYQSLESSFLTGFYFQLAVILTLIVTLLSLFYNSFAGGTEFTPSILRTLAAIIAGSVSFYALVWALGLLSAIYSYSFSSAGINWYNFTLFSTPNFQAANSNISSGTISVLLEFFTFTGYFVAVIGLFSILMMRQALMLLSILLVPFATAIYALKPAAKYSKIVWEIIAEMSAYPFLVLICLYLAHLFAWDIPLQLAFLFLPSIIPGTLLATGRNFMSAPLLGFVGGLSMSGIAARGFQATSIASDIAAGQPMGGIARDIMLMPLSEPPRLDHFNNIHSNSEKLPWKEILQEELKYRKE